MHRHVFISTLLACVIFTTHLVFLGGALLAEDSDRPNVLFIAIDDLRPELGCYGHPLIQSPNIDRLASESILFERAYCQQAVCGPTRASLMTGLRPDSTTIYDLDHPVRKTIPDVLSMPQHFRENGYETRSFGKIYHHSSDDNGIGWSQDAWRASEGEWEGRGYLNEDSIAAIRPPSETGGRTGVGPAFEAADVSDDAYPDGQVAVHAIAEMQRLSEQDAPFFLAVGFVKPHLPFNAPQRYWDLYDRSEIAIPEQDQWPDDAPSFAGTSWGELRGYAGMPRSGAASEELAIDLIHGYYACVSYTDALVGQVLAELERLELNEETIVILWGDHGWKLGDYGAWCKHTNFEIDTHVPMILRVPGRTDEGLRTPALVEFVDIFPTLSDLCGIGVPDACEGASITPLIDDPAREWKAAAFSQYPRSGKMGYTIRSGQWRYTEWINRNTGEVTDRELYDHSDGPVVDRNLIGDAQHASTVERLSELIDGGQGWKAIREALQ